MKTRMQSIMKRIVSGLKVWKVIATLILAAGAVATIERFTRGLGESTHLTDQFPWGLWIGFDILCGVGLAAGGFTLAAIVYVFNVKRFEPVVRPTILTAFLGYLLVIVGLMFDLGRPWQIWHAIIMWNHQSVMFEVAWCVMLYTTVLALEFAPVVLERFQMTRAMKILRTVSIPLIIVGVLLSTLHQSSLGSLYLIVPEKLYGLWYSSYMPLFFYVSAIAVGCAMVIFESCLSSRAFNRGLETHLLSELSRISMVMLAVYATMKIVDLADRSAFSLLFLPRPETYLYWLEITTGIILPIALFSFRKIRESRSGLFFGSTVVILGFIMNRMNISITAMQRWTGTSYFPSWMEIAVTLSIVTVGFIAFSMAAKYLPIFGEETGHPAPIRDQYPLIEDLDVVSQEGAA
ncbi:MAG TPA: Ni/Fe-hydrogenase cytochrome b subunit [Bacteroidota bacterium]|nr:Ni/Fe-hydrogenase cytochrome b subunit [Bacteroidota bacterium]